jgi:hypothetical protein
MKFSRPGLNKDPNAATWSFRATVRIAAVVSQIGVLIRDFRRIQELQTIRV